MCSREICSRLVPQSGNQRVFNNVLKWRTLQSDSLSSVRFSWHLVQKTRHENRKWENTKRLRTARGGNPQSDTPTHIHRIYTQYIYIHRNKTLTSFISAAVVFLVLLSLLAFAFLLITTGREEEGKVSVTASANTELIWRESGSFQLKPATGKVLQYFGVRVFYDLPPLRWKSGYVWTTRAAGLMSESVYSDGKNKPTLMGGDGRRTAASGVKVTCPTNFWQTSAITHVATRGRCQGSVNIQYVESRARTNWYFCWWEKSQ